MSRHLIFSAGDVSGDLYASRLAAELLRRHPDWTIHAVGGAHLASVINGELIADSSNMSAIGICEGVKIWPRGKVISSKLRRFLRSHPADLAVLCDWGYFNCGQFRFLRSLNIPSFYYFPPRSWQRHGKPGLGIVPWIAAAAAPFDWAARRLADAGCDAEWVGHPLLELREVPRDRAALRRLFGTPDDARLIALFPGSRIPELKVIGPCMAAAAEMLRKRIKCAFVAPVPSRLAARASKILPAWIRVLPDRSPEALAACDAAIVKTGSATLEAAILDAPQVAVYDLDWICRIEWVALWAWKRIPFIAMPNLILERMAVPELIGPDCKPESIANSVRALLEDDLRRARMLEDYVDVRRALGADLPAPASALAADRIDLLLGNAPPKAAVRPTFTAAFRNR